MPQYFLAVHNAADDTRMADLSPGEMQQLFSAVETFNAELREAGAWVFAGGLQPIEASTVVDNTGAQPILTDGPYAATEEHLGGFWIVEARDLDAALSWAQKASRACAGKVEVRPFQDEPEG